MNEFIGNNWIGLIFGVMGLLKIVVNLTPTEKDNKIFGYIDTLISLIVPNLKKGGGRFTN